MRLLRLVALTALLVLSTVSAADASPVHSLHATRVFPHAADADGRFVRLPAGPPSNGVIRDDATGKIVTPAPGCTFTAPQRGYVAERCNNPTPTVLDLRTGSRAAIPLGARAIQPGDIVEVGSQWAFFNGPIANFYVNWRTGEQIGAAGFSPYDRSVDLNRARAQRRPTLLRGDVVEGIDSAEILVDLDAQNAGNADPDARGLEALRLRVHSRVLTIRSRCAAGGCVAIQYTGGLLSWVEGPISQTGEAEAGRQVSIWAYDVASRQSFRARVTRLAGFPTLVTHTAKRIYAYEAPLYPSGQTAGGWTVTLPARR